MKKLFTTLAICMVAVTSWAYDAYVDSIYYNLDTTAKTATVTYRYYMFFNELAYSGDVVIPETVTVDGEEYTVNTIGEYAFCLCEDVTSITMPNTVKTVEACAFYYMDNLVSVVMPDSLETIGDYAFGYADKLESITIPQSVTSIGDEILQFCPMLTTVYYNAKEITNYYGATIFPPNMTNIYLGDSVQSLPGYFLVDCYDVKTITLPSGLTSIGEYAFKNCTSLSTIYSKNASAPSCVSTTFETVDTTQCVVYVPEGSLDSYAQATGWMDFINIEETSIIGNGSEAGIQAVSESIAHDKPAIYDLNGQIVNDISQKGLYIINGKKVLKQ